jgi:hypothetical protein
MQAGWACVWCTVQQLVVLLATAWYACVPGSVCCILALSMVNCVTGALAAVAAPLNACWLVVVQSVSTTLVQ